MGKHSGNCERSRLSSPCRVQGSRGGSAAEHRVSKVCAAVKPAFGGLPSSVTVRRKSAAPRHLPQGEGKAALPQSTEFAEARQGVPKKRFNKFSIYIGS